MATILLLAYAALSFYPFAWMVLGEFKSNPDLLAHPDLLPVHWYWQPIAETWERLQFAADFVNSAIYTVLSLIGILVIYPMAAFALAKVEFRGRDLLFAGFVAVMLIPGITNLIPLVVLEQRFGLTNTWLGLVLPSVNSAAPFAIYLLRNYFRAIPHELYESALLDGASRFGVYRHIYLPLSVPALITVGILNLVSLWSAYIVPSLLISKPEMFTLPLGLYVLHASPAPQWNHLLAGSTFIVVPIVIVFIILQRYYIAGLMAGASR